MNGKKRRFLCAAAVLLLLSLGVGLFSGCGKTMHYVDYGEDKYVYRGARDAYRTGEKVTLYYNLIATDTDYTFLLDGEKLNPEYDEKSGYKLQFVMPDHDVKLECVKRNSALALEEESEQAGQDAEAKDVLLVGYTSRKGAPEDGNLYALSVFESDDEKEVFLEIHASSVKENQDVRARYKVSSEVVQAVMSLVLTGDLREWAACSDPVREKGRTQTCRFLDGDEYIEVSTDAMPEGGDQTLQDIRHTIESYIPKF